MKDLADRCAVPSTAGGLPQTSEGLEESHPSLHGGLALISAWEGTMLVELERLSSWRLNPMSLTCGYIWCL